MSIVFDLIILLLVGVTLYVVVKKGFVKTVFDFATVIASVIIAKIFSPKLSDYFYEKLFEGVSEKIKDVVTDLIEKKGLPEFLQSDKISQFLTKYNADLAEKLKADFIGDTVEFISGHVVAILSYSLAFVIIFIAALIILKIVSVVVCAVFELPVLKSLNKTLAFLLGVVLAVIYVLIFVAVAQLLIPVLSPLYPNIFSEGLIDKTFVFKYLYNFDWIDFLVN